VLLPRGTRQWEEEGKEEHGLLLALAVSEQKRPFSFFVHVQAKGQDKDAVESRCGGQRIEEHRVVSR